MTSTRAAQRRQLRHRELRRRRGGAGRGPVVVQRTVRAVVDGASTARRGWRRLVHGDRSLAVVLVVAVALTVLMLSGPTQRYLDGRERVDALAAKVDALEPETERLEQRVDDLEDPNNVELLAREQQGFIRPGEVPYTLVPPEVDRPRITAPRDRIEPAPQPWYQRAWDRVSGWFGSGG